MSDARTLPQTFILPQDLPFAAIRAALVELGFRDRPMGVQSAPLIDGEPEAAAWAWPGGLPVLSYRFTPVARLRLLEVGTTPPGLRAEIAARLSPLPPQAIGEALTSGDDRQRLFGVWAAVETERLDLIHDIGIVAETARGGLKDEAETALYKLGDLADLQLKTLAGTRLIATAAMDVIAGLATPDGAAALLPTRTDCADLFVPQIAGQVAETVAAQDWPRRGVHAQPRDADDVFASPGGALRWSNPVADAFPMGYRKIAGWLQPGPIWIAWLGDDGEGTRVRFDGLVFVGGRWVFFPKAFRLVEPLLPALPHTARHGAA